MPLVSVIIPTYNRADLLRLTLDSVVAQTFSDYEIIVVDDGSFDDSNEVLCARYTEIQYIKIKNSGGPSKPRNIGIEMAKGKYIAFVDDDDLWLPRKLEKQVSVLNNNPEFGLVHTPCNLINLQGNLTGIVIGRPGTPDVKHGDVKMRMIGNWTLMMPTVLIRKEVLRNVGNFNTHMPQAGEDAEFWSRCSFYTKFYYIDEPLALYREHQSNSKVLKAKYIELPLYLKKVLDTVFKKELINKEQYLTLRNMVVRKQIKELPLGIGKTIWLLFKLNPFWFFKFGNIKLFIKMLKRFFS